MIAIFDYGAGNLRSVQNTLEAIGAPFGVVKDASGLERASKIVLPGVGHFGQMMRSLDALGVRDALKDRILAGVPFLGICLGLQGLFESSLEAPGVEGLGLYKGSAERFPAHARVPQMGWNTLKQTRRGRLLDGMGDGFHVYFAHSYYVPLCEATSASCEYETEYTAVLEQGNTFGVQFHPEKSGPVGQRIVRNFVEM